jgi:hypothetical protein
LQCAAASPSEQFANLRRIRESTFFLLREDELFVGEDVELALLPGLDLGLVPGLGVQLGRETRGPFVVTVSDRAVEDLHARHSGNLPMALHAIIIPHTV